MKQSYWFFILSCVFTYFSTAQNNYPQSEFLPLDSLLNVHISTASRHWQKASEAPASISVINSGQIDSYGYETILDALNRLSGFYSSNDRNYSYIGVRGFSRPSDYNNRILLMLNGHTINENVYGSIDADNTFALDLNCVERIEVVRGPGSALYGTGAMFGVINLITQRGQTLSSTNVQVAYGSQTKRRASIFYGHTFENGLDVLVSGVWGDSKGENLFYQEFNGTARDLDWEKYYSIFSKIEYQDFTVQGMFISRSKGVPTAPYGVTFDDPSTQTLDARGFIGIEYNKDVSSILNLKLTAYYDRYKYDGTFPYDSLENYPSYVQTFDGSLGEWFTGEIQTRWSISSKYFVVFGGEYRYNPQSSYFYHMPGFTFFDTNVNFSSLSLYLHHEYQFLPWLLAVGGLRYDHFTNSISSLSPRLGLIVTPSYATTVKLLYGTAFRRPNFYESYYEDQTSNFVQSIDLQGEQILTSEAILEQRISDNLFGVLSLYHNQMRDLIDQVYDESDSTTTFKNISQSSADGIEVSLQYHVNTHWSGYLNYNYQSAVDKSTSSVLTNSPEHLIKLGSSWRSETGLSLGAELFYETQRWTVWQTRTKSFLLCNAFASYKFWNEQFLVALRIQNLFNETYSLPGGFEHLQSGIEQNGRTAEIRLRFSF